MRKGMGEDTGAETGTGTGTCGEGRGGTGVHLKYSFVFEESTKKRERG